MTLEFLRMYTVSMKPKILVLGFCGGLLLILYPFLCNVMVLYWTDMAFFRRKWLFSFLSVFVEVLRKDEQPVHWNTMADLHINV
jgi:hypothetical protein